MQRLIILTICSVLIAACIFFFKKRSQSTVPADDGLVIKKMWLSINQNPVTPEKDRRPADQTFLTFPEWYLVFSPAEQADYFKTHTSTSFPYMKHVSQIWQSYKIVKQQIKGNFPVNKGYHFMIWVIGTSATIEYSAKALYETLIGRLTDTKAVITDEDKFNAKYTQDYVDFIKDKPWYEFDFKSRLSTLWRGTSFFGDHFLRKIERKYMLTSELLVKTVYGKLIKLGTKTVYDEALPNTVVLVNELPDDTTGMNIIEKLPDSTALLNLPRYDKFNAAVTDLAKKGIVFKEIAGNNSAILLSLIMPKEQNIVDDNAQLVFTQPFASDASMKRVVIAVTVPNLNLVLKKLDAENVKVEHVFDY